MADQKTNDNNDQPIITIRGEKIGLGPLRRDLLDTLHLRWGNDLSAGLMQGAAGFATTAHGERFFKNRTGNNDVEEFLIYELESLRPIGSANLHDIDRGERSAEVACNIMEKSARRRGYGTEATLLALDYAFTVQSLHSVRARVFEYNTPSLGMVKKAGFQEVGRLREARWAGNRYWDIIIFDMLQHEFTSPALARDLAFLDIENRD